jgi:thiol-disulfide isomerase/thioredoxin
MSGIRLFLFKANWCGHCKSLVPIFDKLQVQLHNEGVASAYKCEYTNPDDAKMFQLFKITSFPTIIMYKPSLDIYIEYLGPRTLESLSTFVKEHVSMPNSIEISKFKYAFATLHDLYK